VLGEGWELLSIHNSIKSNVAGFDHESAIKRNLSIVSAITALDLPNGQSVYWSCISVFLTKHQIIHYYRNLN
jgi:hypothetical protein